MHVCVCVRIHIYVCVCHISLKPTPTLSHPHPSEQLAKTNSDSDREHWSSCLEPDTRTCSLFASYFPVTLIPCLVSRRLHIYRRAARFSVECAEGVRYKWKFRPYTARLIYLASAHQRKPRLCDVCLPGCWTHSCGICHASSSLMTELCL